MFRRLFGVVPALLSLSRTRRVRESDLLLPPSPPLPPLAEAVTRRNVELPLPGGAAGRALRGWYLERPGNLRTLIYFPGNQESLLRIAWRLHWMADNLDVNVLAFDYRGYGFSDGRATLGTIAYDGAVIYDHLEEVQPEGAGLPVIYGRSIGSLAAIETAVSRPVAGLILEGAPSAASDVIPSWRGRWRPGTCAGCCAFARTLPWPRGAPSPSIALAIFAPRCWPCTPAKIASCLRCSAVVSSTRPVRKTSAGARFPGLPTTPCGSIAIRRWVA
ncbi:MAG: hypothetical protein Q9Q13_11485 [Acidobacteriota bacterium]|nr:hypothetical protein [Acidobacteriota bacterium]